MSENWLETAGSWLARPFKALALPWWNELVVRKAEDAALRLKLLEAIVSFRVSDFAKALSVDSDRAIGIATKVLEHLKPSLSVSPPLDLTSSAFLNQLENEIQLCGIPFHEWLKLACLAHAGLFCPKHALIVEFTLNGCQSHLSTMIAGLQTDFPFWKNLFILDGPPSANCRLSDESIAALTKYVEGVELPEAKYQIRPTMPQFGERLTDPLILPKAWKPV